jgi:hypothetical protein
MLLQVNICTGYQILRPKLQATVALTVHRRVFQSNRALSLMEVLHMGTVLLPRRISPVQGTILTLDRRRANQHNRLRFTKAEEIQTNLCHLWHL